jgi:signal transduction histidine kinase
MFSSLKFKFYSTFLFLSLLSVFIVFANHLMKREEQRINTLEDSITQTFLYSLENSKNIIEFIQNDTRNPQFFETGKSNLIDKINANYFQIEQNLNQISQMELMQTMQLNSNFNLLKSAIYKRHSNYNSLKNLVFKRGYTESGYIGKMRKAIHNVENKFPQYQVAILSIRRNEKDYLLRLDSVYVGKLFDELDGLISKIKKGDNRFELKDLYDYKSNFNKIIRINNLIGTNQNQGIFSLLIQNDNDIKSISTNLIRLLKNKKIEIESSLESIFYYISIIGIILSLLVAIYFSNKLSEPIIKLSKHTQRFISNQFKLIEKLDIKTREKEFKVLFDNYSKMEIEISNLIYDFNKKVEEKTKTIQEQNNSLVELNATKDRFFSIIAHDLKGPFVSLIEFSKKLNENYEKLADEKRLKYIQNINTISSQTFKLLENLLEWSRIQSDHVVINKEINDIYKEVKNVLAISSSIAELKNISISNLVEKKLLVPFDKSVTNTIIRNLVSNAIKFTPNGGTISVSSIKQDNQIEISIKDSGVGIPQERIEKLFKVDQNTSTKGTNQEKGTGLGLILCKDLIEKQGGNIYVSSQLNVGTEIKFTIPIVEG